jgi:predicted nuclease with TOPRIM domain
MTFKTAAKSVGNGLLNGLGAIADAQTRNRIEEIDTEMSELQEQLDQLQEERDRLEKTLIGQ